MKPEDIRQALDKLKADYDALLFDVATKFLDEATKKIFADLPGLDSFGFMAYTPYFNDGEECEYRVRHDDVFINGFSQYFDEDDAEDQDGKVMEGYFDPRPGDCNVWDGVKYDWQTKKYNGPKMNVALINAVQEFVKGVGTELWKDLIGDHVIVRISRDGFEAVKYDHE